MQVCSLAVQREKIIGENSESKRKPDKPTGLIYIDLIISSSAFSVEFEIRMKAFNAAFEFKGTGKQVKYWNPSRVGLEVQRTRTHIRQLNRYLFLN